MASRLSDFLTSSWAFRAHYMMESWAISRDDGAFFANLWIAMIKTLDQQTHGGRYWAKKAKM